MGATWQPCVDFGIKMLDLLITHEKKIPANCKKKKDVESFYLKSALRPLPPHSGEEEKGERAEELQGNKGRQRDAQEGFIHLPTWKMAQDLLKS